MLKEGVSQKEIKARLDRMHRQNAFSKSSIQRWYSSFRSRCIQKQNLPKSGTPTKRTPAKIQAVCASVNTNKRFTIRQIAQDVQLSFSCTCRILKENLKLTKRPAKWVPHLLTAAERCHHVNMSQQSWQFLRQRGNPIDTEIAQDESWFHSWDPEPNNKTKEWLAAGEEHPKKVQIECTVRKAMLIVFLDKDGVVHKEFIPDGYGIGAELYLKVLERFMTSLRHRRPHLTTRQGLTQWAFLQDGAPAHHAHDTLAFLRQHHVQILPHPGYSPDLNPLDYWFFNRIKAKV